jgi:hypothetical protein
MARKFNALLTIGIALALLIVPVALTGMDADMGSAVTTVDQYAGSGMGAVDMSVFVALAGIAILLFSFICLPNIIIEMLAKHKAKVDGVEYEPICKPFTFNCPDCGVMVEEDFGFCSKCGKVFAKDMKVGTPKISIHHNARLT